MRKHIAGAAIVASVVTGGIGGAMFGVPVLAGAAETASEATSQAESTQPSWVRDALSGLVEKGTIDQSQADAVEEALAAARPPHPAGFGGHRHGHLPGFDAVAEALGISEDELRTSLRDGKTIAALAADRGVEVQTVVDAIVAAQRERLAEAVESGRLTQAQADAMLEQADERATAFVNGERPPHPDGPPAPGA